MTTPAPEPANAPDSKPSDANEACVIGLIDRCLTRKAQGWPSDKRIDALASVLSEGRWEYMTASEGAGWKCLARALIAEDLIVALRAELAEVTDQAAMAEVYKARAESELAAVKEERDEIQGVFDRGYAASMDAINQWRAAHPGNDMVWPDRRDLTRWLLDELKAVKEALALEKAERQRARMLLILTEADLAALKAKPQGDSSHKPVTQDAEPLTYDTQAEADERELIEAWRDAFGLVICRNPGNTGDRRTVERFWQLMNRKAGIASPHAVVPQRQGPNISSEHSAPRSEHSEAEVERVLQDWLKFASDVCAYDAAGRDWLDALHQRTRALSAMSPRQGEAERLREALRRIAADEKFDGILGSPVCGHPEIAADALTRPAAPSEKGEAR